MRYWDTSALLPLFVRQEATGEVRALYEADDRVSTWSLTDVEISSAFARLARESWLSPLQHAELTKALDTMWRGVHLVDRLEAVRGRAKRCLRVHTLLAADALQLAAALVASQDAPEGLELVCLDRRLADAARREGFPVLPG